MNGFTFARTSFVVLTAAVCALASSLLISGCQTKYDRQMAFTAALDNYYSARQDCLFANPIQFPVTANSLNKDQKAQFDALVSAGLLQRQTAQYAPHQRHQSSQEGYALSNIGRLDWTADQTHLGYGNFCFGNPQVKRIQSSTEIAGVTPTRYKVSYRDRVILPAWAAEPQVEKVFPQIVEDSSGQTSSATLVKSSSGWKVQNVSPAAATPVG